MVTGVSEDLPVVKNKANFQSPESSPQRHRDPSAACGRNQNESATDFADYHRFLKKDYRAEARESTTAGLFPPS
jgi:hypothetical protein